MGDQVGEMGLGRDLKWCSLQPVREAMVPETMISVSDGDCEGSFRGYGLPVKPENTIESWLPITESRNGNVFTVACHLLCSTLQYQVLLLPPACVVLGWTWGIICLTVAFLWHLYTTWLLIHLHEPAPGTRYSRYVRLSIAAFGEKRGKILAVFPVMYLSGGACVILIITGGTTMEQLYSLLFDSRTNPVTATEWFLIFTCIAVVLAQFPSLNSMAVISLIGGITAVTYCILIWVLPVSNGKPSDVSYRRSETQFSEILNAIGFVMLAFRGHNLVLEIQGTLPSNPKRPSATTMWRATTVSYAVIALCFFPLSSCLYWAYGDKIPTSSASAPTYLNLYVKDYSKLAMCFVHAIFIASCLCSYALYAMPSVDNFEFLLVSKTQKRSAWWVRTFLRLLFGGVTFFVATTFPFLPSLAVLVGAIAIPLTFVYPCFIWIVIKKPRRFTPSWCLNLGLGSAGVALSVVLLVAAALRLADRGLRANFFHPQ